MNRYELILKNFDKNNIFFINWAQSMLESLKPVLDAWIKLEQVWVMGMVLPSPIEISSVHVYSSRLWGLVVTWWVAPGSRILEFPDEYKIDAKLALASKCLCDLERQTAAVRSNFWHNWHLKIFLYCLLFCWLLEFNCWLLEFHCRELDSFHRWLLKRG